MRFVMMICLLVGLMASQGHAQGLGSLLTKPAETQQSGSQNIDEILDRAAQNGVAVIVIDSAGNLISQPAQTDDQTVAVGEEQVPSPLMALQDRAIGFRSAVADRLLNLPDAFNEVQYILRATSPDGTIWAFAQALLLSLLMLAAGALVEREIYSKRVMKGLMLRRTMDKPKGYIEKIPFLVYRFSSAVVGILVSMAVAYALGFAIFGTLTHTAIQFTVTLINIGYFACRFVASLWRMILCPYLEQYRIPALSNRDARRLHNWLWTLATFDICAILFGIWIGDLGLNYDVYAFLASMLSAALVIAHLVLLVVNYRAISHALRNGKAFDDCTIYVRVLSKIWGPMVVFYLLFAWFELTYDLVLDNPSSTPLIAGAYGILLTILVVYGLMNYFIERSFVRARALRRLNTLNEEKDDDAAASTQAETAPFDDDLHQLEQELERTQEIVAEEEARIAALGPRRQINTYEDLARRVAGILAFVAGAYAFFFIWDNDGAEMVESYADRLLDIMVIIFVGYIIYHAFRIWIDSKIEEETGDLEVAELGDEGGGTSASRLATLLPLFRNFMLIVVVIAITLISLMEMGVNVGPLFAGAGIVGIAIGFGSQALVRDVFAGAFFLFDDAFRKGEYLDVGNVKGTVEKISVRSFQLRHHLGALHTIPFGELQVITNYARDWVMMKLPLRVTYDTDVEKVRKLIKNLGIELLDDPVIGENFIQPLKSQGVIEMQDSAMIIRVKFMTKPGDQWLVRKRVYEDIRELFEIEGIKFAHREVTVRLAGDKADDLSIEQKRDIAAAAHASLEDDELDDLDDGGDDR